MTDDDDPWSPAVAVTIGPADLAEGFRLLLTGETMRRRVRDAAWMRGFHLAAVVFVGMVIGLTIVTLELGDTLTKSPGRWRWLASVVLPTTALTLPVIVLYVISSHRAASRRLGELIDRPPPVEPDRRALVSWTDAELRFAFDNGEYIMAFDATQAWEATADLVVILPPDPGVFALRCAQLGEARDVLVGRLERTDRPRGYYPGGGLLKTMA